MDSGAGCSDMMGIWLRLLNDDGSCLRSRTLEPGGRPTSASKVSTSTGLVSSNSRIGLFVRDQLVASAQNNGIRFGIGLCQLR